MIEEGVDIWYKLALFKRVRISELAHMIGRI
jgi:hypothetical protein